MNAKTALAMALLRGEVITIKTGFKNFGITNIPREISRQIEQPFGVEISKVRKKGRTRYKVRCTWYEYRLNFTKYNLPGIKEMKEYVAKHTNGMFVSPNSNSPELF